MARQWKRQCRLTIGNGSDAVIVSGMSDGAGNLLEGLRVRFHVNQETYQAPENAEVTITNLSDATANKIQKEYDRFVLEIGYPENLATVFEGEIVQKRKGRENPTDTYLTLLARGGQRAYSYGVVNKSLASGHTLRDQVDAVLEALKPYGITAGAIADLGAAKMPRGRALFGMARDHLRAITQTAGCSWWVANNKLNIVKHGETLPGAVVVLNSDTGMIGMPSQTMGGIEVRCLINPEIKAGSKIQIDEASIQRAALTTNYSAQAQQYLVPDVASDGIYKVLGVTMSGDTRGTDWYQDLACLAVGTSIVPDSMKQTYLSVDTN